MNGKADKIFINGNIYTQNRDMPWAEAAAVKDRTFICVGTNDECTMAADEATEIIDLGGRTVLPGLIDGHTHPETIANTFWRVRMPRITDLNEMLEYIKNYCKKHPVEEVPYFFGENYISEMFDENGPHKELLDTYVSDRPARIQDFTDHACWYNSKALELMGMVKGTPNPRGPMGCVEFVRDKNGEPTGWALEGTTEHEEGMYEKIGWHPPKVATEESITPFLSFLKSKGIVCLMDGFTEGEEGIRLFYDMDKAGRLDMYYEATCILTGFDTLEESIATVNDWRKKYTTEHVQANVIKFFMDGTNEMGDSAGLEPMKTDPEGKDYGRANITEDQLEEVLVRLNEERLDMHIHVVCDRGFRICCNAVERARKICGPDWRIYVTLAHCELVHPDDMKRVADLGIFIDWSTHWAGGYFGEAAIRYLGMERWVAMYDFTKIIAYGGTVGFSSDVFSYQEANRADPFFGMQISMTRVDIEIPLDPEKFPNSVRPPLEARLSLEQLIQGYTVNNAVRMRMQDRLGSIETGKKANLAVLNKNIFELPAERVREATPEMVVFEGRITTYDKPLGI